MKKKNVKQRREREKATVFRETKTNNYSMKCKRLIEVSKTINYNMKKKKG